MMGTNYYVIVTETGTCMGCGQPHKDTTQYHFGKSSAGWYFMVQTYPDEGIFILEDWVNFIVENDCEIVDEYGNEFNLIELLAVVMDRGRNKTISEKTYPEDVKIDVPRGLYYEFGGMSTRSLHGPWSYSNKDFS